MKFIEELKRIQYLFLFVVFFCRNRKCLKYETKNCIQSWIESLLYRMLSSCFINHIFLWGIQLVCYKIKSYSRLMADRMTPHNILLNVYRIGAFMFLFRCVKSMDIIKSVQIRSWWLKFKDFGNINKLSLTTLPNYDLIFCQTHSGCIYKK